LFYFSLMSLPDAKMGRTVLRNIIEERVHITRE
jgi:hypothetical protein